MNRGEALTKTGYLMLKSPPPPTKMEKFQGGPSENIPKIFTDTARCPTEYPEYPPSDGTQNIIISDVQTLDRSSRKFTVWDIGQNMEYSGRWGVRQTGERENGRRKARENIRNIYDGHQENNVEIIRTERRCSTATIFSGKRATCLEIIQPIR
jgi:hypothetical protein